VRWEVSWRGGGTTGSLPPLHTVSGFVLRVRECPALNTR